MVPLGLAGRAVLVTGPAKGMGRAITLALAEAGADLLLVGRDLDAIAPVAAEADALGRRALVVRADVTNEPAVAAAAARAEEAFGETLYGLVNVAGVAGPSGASLWEHTVADYRRLFDANVLGPVLTMKHLLPMLMARGRGSVVNIGGTFGFKGVRKAALYGATKWALRGLSKSAALEAAAGGVRVNMVSPGGVEGPRLTRQLGEQAARDGIGYAAAHARFCATAALGRMSTDADVANAVLFLMGDAARNITGQDLLVDGGTIV